MAVEHNTIIISWNQVIPGREAQAGELFASRFAFLEKLRKSGRLESWEPLIMSPHGGAPLGMFILRGTHENLTWLWDDGEFQEHNMRAMHLLTEFSVLPAFGGKAASDVLSIWAKASPR
jgi:hypothetical protein